MRHTVHDDVRFLLDHQAPGGAYVASPSFSQYPFGWLRDGAFIAHALRARGRARQRRRLPRLGRARRRAPRGPTSAP
jgi:hypothetical protein